MISDDMLIIVPVRNLVLFPGTVLPVAINRDRSLAAAQEAVRAERKVGFLLQHEPDTQNPTPGDLYKVGTVANIVRYVTGQDGTGHAADCTGRAENGSLHSHAPHAVVATRAGFCRCVGLLCTHVRI